MVKTINFDLQMHCNDLEKLKQNKNRRWKKKNKFKKCLIDV